MDTLAKRKRGGQPGNRNAVGNQNAVKHGRYTAAAKAARLARLKEIREEERRRHAEWVKTISQVDYASRIEELKRLRAERALTEPDLWGPVE